MHQGNVHWTKQLKKHKLHAKLCQPKTNNAPRSRHIWFLWTKQALPVVYFGLAEIRMKLVLLQSICSMNIFLLDSGLSMISLDLALCPLIGALFVLGWHNFAWSLCFFSRVVQWAFPWCIQVYRFIFYFCWGSCYIQVSRLTCHIVDKLHLSISF